MEEEIKNVVVLATKDYGIFKDLPHNRGLSENEKIITINLQRSVLEKNLLFCRPIVVREEDMTVIDGHRRLDVAKRNGLYIYYILVKNVDYKDAIRLTGATNDWSLPGYIKCRSENGEEEFKKLDTFLKTYKISGAVLYRLLSRQKRGLKKLIREGNFQFTKEMESLGPYIEVINEIVFWLVESGIPRGKNSQINHPEFYFGIYSVLKNPNCNIGKLKLSVKENIFDVSSERRSWKRVAQSLVQIYNRGTRSKRISLDEVIEKYSK